MTPLPDNFTAKATANKCSDFQANIFQWRSIDRKFVYESLYYVDLQWK